MADYSIDKKKGVVYVIGKTWIHIDRNRIRMLNSKTATVAFVLLFSFGIAFLPGDAHAFGDCCQMMAGSGADPDSLKRPFSTGSCAGGCCSGLTVSLCNLNECGDPALPDYTVSSATFRQHKFLAIAFFLKEVTIDDAPSGSMGKRRLPAPRALSTPLYLLTLSLLC